MKPAEKVRAILDEFTKPLTEDSPFSSKGRKVSFNNDNSEMGNLSFQAFFSRINTFEQEYWGSDPSAAMFLAKYGFKVLSRHKVQCVSCRFEMDMKVMLAAKSKIIIHTLAVSCHKKSCRWLRISTPGEYFEIPKNPRRILQDLEVTIADLAELESDLPLVKKKSWLQMGLKKEIVQTILDFFDTPINQFSVSCVVLSLCGWIKSSNTTVQCNFCQKVIGGNNVFTEVNNHQKPLLPPKHSRVVSLLYKEIKRDMGLKKTNDGSSSSRIHEEEICEIVPEAVAVPENKKNELKISKEEICRMSNASSVMYAQNVKKKACRFLWNSSRRWREKYPFTMLNFKSNRDLTFDFEELPGPVVQPNELPREQHEDSPVSKEPHEVPKMPQRQRMNICGIITDSVFINNTEWLVPCMLASNDHVTCRTSDNDGMSDINDGIRLNPYLAGDNKEHSRLDHNNRNGLNSPCESFDSSEEISVASSDKSVLSMPPEEFISGNNLSPGEAVCSFIDTESRSGEAEAPLKTCRTHPTFCNCEVCTTQTNLIGKLDNCDSSSNLPKKSCNSSEVISGNGEVSSNSSGRRKKKCVPESDQNGTPNSSDSQVLQDPARSTRSKKKVFELMDNKPAHFTRSKKREFELMHSELSKSTSLLESKSCSDNVREACSDHEQEPRESSAHAKKSQNIPKNSDPSSRMDKLNVDTGNEQDNANNGTKEKTINPGHKPGKCSVGENAFQNVQKAKASTNRIEMIYGTEDIEKFENIGKKCINGETQENSTHAPRFQNSLEAVSSSTYRDKTNIVIQDVENYEAYKNNLEEKEFVQSRYPQVNSTRFPNAPRIGSSSKYSDQICYATRIPEKYESIEEKFLRESRDHHVRSTRLRNKSSSMYKDKINYFTQGASNSTTQSSVKGGGEREEDDKYSEKITSEDTIDICSSSSEEGEDEDESVNKKNCETDSVETTSEPDILSAASNVFEVESEKTASKSDITIISTHLNVGKENEVNLQNNLRNTSFKRKRNNSEDSVISCGPSEMCHSYVHPELEHRFWCIWRIPFTDYQETLIEKKKGWEYYSGFIQEALELYKTGKH